MGAFCEEAAIASETTIVAASSKKIGATDSWMMWAMSPISLSPMFGLNRQGGAFRISTKPEMEPVKKARRDGAHERGQVPQQVRFEIIEHDSSGERPDCIRNANG